MPSYPAARHAGQIILPGDREGAGIEAGSFVCVVNFCHPSIKLELMKAAELDDLATRAATAFRAGKFADARKWADLVLAEGPEHVDANYVRALLLHRMGQIKEAGQVLEPIVRANLQKVKIVSLFGDVLRLSGRVAEALRAFEHVLQRSPDYPEALFGIACVRGVENNLPEAINLLKKAVAAAPRRADFAIALSQAHQQMNQGQLCDKVLETALQQVPGHPDLLEKLGTWRGRSGRLLEAESMLRQAIANDPDHPNAHINLSVCLYLQRRVREALEVVLEPLERHPNRENLNSRAGQMYYELGEPERALVYLDKALAITPEQVLPSCTRGLCLLSIGRWREAWPLYEWRYRDPNFPHRLPQVNFPRWNGEPLTGRSITIWSEQGNGDHIQYIRFAKWFRDRGAHVIFRCLPALVELLSTCPFPHRVVSTEDPAQATDYYIPMMSCPGQLAMEPGDVACASPYISIPEKHRRAFSEELSAHEGKKKIGLVWAGASSNLRDFQRSMKLEQLLPLREARPDAAFFSLQKDNAAMQINELRSSWPIVDLGRRSHSWTQTAAIIDQLDMLICVDTAVAHIAGALGKPVWMMITRAHDFRWPHAGQTTAWYPTMRLFRQSQQGDWSTVVEEMALELKALP